MSETAQRVTSSSLPAASRTWIPALAIAALVIAVGADVFRIGYFADDFHFLDVARRIPLLHALDGQFGVFPWYRPLSRELLFSLIVSSGAAGLVVAHAIGLACIGLAAWQVRSLGLRLGSARSAAIAAALFLACSLTKFLLAWVSGFQDLLALLLVLLAVRAQLEGQLRRAATWAFLGVFAKETAFLVFPLLAVYGLMSGEARRLRPWLWHGSALVAASAIHLWVRTSWTGHSGIAHVERSLPALGGSLLEVPAGFLARPGTPGASALALALLAAAATWVLLRSAAPDTVVAARGAPQLAGTGPIARPAAFLSVAACLGVLPLLVGHALALTRAESYYGFSAVPWLALLLASWLARIPRDAGNLVTIAIVGWNSLALGFEPVDLATPQAWEFRRWDWRESVRLSAVADRLQSDIRSNLATRPESLVVLLCGMENGCYFQTEDGPAAREALRDPTVRAYWLYSPPFGLRTGHFEILAFNTETRHLERHRLPTDLRIQLAAQALTRGQAPAAWALASYGDSSENARPEFRYLRMASALLATGPAGARRELTEGFALRATTPALDWAGRPVPANGPLAAALTAMLRLPLNAGEHVALADAFHDAGAVMPEVLELRIATTLDPALARARVRMAAGLPLVGSAPLTE